MGSRMGLGTGVVAASTVCGAAVVLVPDALAGAVLDMLLSLCTVPVPEASWCGNGKQWIGWRGERD